VGFKYNAKGKYNVSVHAMKAYRGSRDITPFILNVGSRWRYTISLTTRPLFLGRKSSSFTLSRRLGVLEKFKSLISAGIRTWTIQLLA
jgi:hypothetical protein